ncbi:MAG: hypothetical protein AAGI15_06830 [Pseudomonadota bacterium]
MAEPAPRAFAAATVLATSLAFALVVGPAWETMNHAGAQGGVLYLLCYGAGLACVAVPLLLLELQLGRRGDMTLPAGLDRLVQRLEAPGAWRWLGGAQRLVLLLLSAPVLMLLGAALRAVVTLAQGQPAALVLDVPVAAPSLESELSGVLAALAVLAGLLWCAARSPTGAVQRGLALMFLGVLGTLAVLAAADLLADPVRLAGARAGFAWPDASSRSLAMLAGAVAAGALSLLAGSGVYVAAGGRLPVAGTLGRLLGMVLVAQLFLLLVTMSLQGAPGAGLLPARYLAAAVCVLVLLAASLALLQLMAPLMHWMSQRFEVSAGSAGVLILTLCWMLSMVGVLGHGDWQSVRVLDRSLLETAIWVGREVLLPGAALGWILFVGWGAQREVMTIRDLRPVLTAPWRLMIRYLTPVLLVICVLRMAAPPS